VWYILLRMPLARERPRQLGNCGTLVSLIDHQHTTMTFP
jgi:hypothetical protein